MHSLKNLKLLCFSFIFISGCGENTTTSSPKVFSFENHLSSCDSSIDWDENALQRAPSLNQSVIAVAKQNYGKHPYKVCGEYVNYVSLKTNTALYYELGPHKQPRTEEYTYGSYVGSVSASNDTYFPQVLPGDIFTWKGGLVFRWNEKTRPKYKGYFFNNKTIHAKEGHVGFVAKISKDRKTVCTLDHGYLDGKGARYRTMDLYINDIDKGSIRFYRPTPGQSGPKTFWRYPGDTTNYSKCHPDQYGKCSFK